MQELYRTMFERDRNKIYHVFLILWKVSVEGNRRIAFGFFSCSCALLSPAVTTKAVLSNMGDVLLFLEDSH